MVQAAINTQVIKEGMEMYQHVKHLICSCKDNSLNPRTHIKVSRRSGGLPEVLAQEVDTGNPKSKLTRQTG